MITTISKQGGRRYPQMWSGWSAHQWLPSVGEVEEVIDPATLHGWLEYTVADRLHYEVEGRLHYTPGSQDI